MGHTCTLASVVTRELKYETIYMIAFWLTKGQKSAPYHRDPANSIVFTSKRLPLQPVSSKRNHQVADKFRKMGCLNFFYDCMSKLFLIFFSKFCLFLSFKVQSFSSKHKLHLFDPPLFDVVLCHLSTFCV